MKHKTIEAIDLAYNLVKIGGNSCVRYTNILGGYYSGECKEFVNQVRKYGYDVLSKTDQGFKEKLDSYNRVLELQAKKNGLSSYTKHEFDELCVCGDWIFMEHDCVTSERQNINITTAVILYVPFKEKLTLRKVLFLHALLDIFVNVPSFCQYPQKKSLIFSFADFSHSLPPHEQNVLRLHLSIQVFFLFLMP